MSDDIRNRFRPSRSTESSKQSTKLGWKSKDLPKKTKNQHTSSTDIFSIWDDQHRMQAEEDKMALELAETKRKAKELQKTLRRHRYGELKYGSIATIKKSKSKLIISTNKSIQFIKEWAVSNKKLSPALGTSLVILVIFSIYSQFQSNTTETLGVNSSLNGGLLDDGRQESLPEFSLVYPAGKDSSSLQNVTRKAPDGSIIHSYLDNLSGIDIEVTQQELPESFKTNKEGQLFNVASSFQATNVIQIDDIKVYAGVNEKSGIQSLFTVKDNKLISIKSAQKLTDDQWAGYITSLK